MRVDFKILNSVQRYKKDLEYANFGRHFFYSYMLLIETTRPLLDDSRVPHPLETVSIEYIYSLRKNPRRWERLGQKIG